MGRSIQALSENSETPSGFVSLRREERHSVNINKKTHKYHMDIHVCLFYLRLDLGPVEWLLP